MAQVVALLDYTVSTGRNRPIQYFFIGRIVAPGQLLARAACGSYSLSQTIDGRAGHDARRPTPSQIGDRRSEPGKAHAANDR